MNPFPWNGSAKAIKPTVTALPTSETDPPRTQIRTSIVDSYADINKRIQELEAAGQIVPTEIDYSDMTF